MGCFDRGLWIRPEIMEIGARMHADLLGPHGFVEIMKRLGIGKGLIAWMGQRPVFVPDIGDDRVLEARGRARIPLLQFDDNDVFPMLVVFPRNEEVDALGRKRQREFDGDLAFLIDPRSKAEDVGKTV